MLLIYIIVLNSWRPLGAISQSLPCRETICESKYIVYPEHIPSMSRVCKPEYPEHTQSMSRACPEHSQTMSRACPEHVQSMQAKNRGGRCVWHYRYLTCDLLERP